MGLRFGCVCLREPGYGRLREPLFQSVRYKTSSSAEKKEVMRWGDGWQQKSELGRPDLRATKSGERAMESVGLRCGSGEASEILPGHQPVNFLGALNSLWRSGNDYWLDCSMVETLLRGCNRKLKGQGHLE